MSYDSVAGLRAEGVTNPPYDDPRCQLALDLATLIIDAVTGWWFEPRSLVLLLDGRGHDMLYVQVPIVEVTKIETGHDTDWSELDLDSVDVYNRHLSGQASPVDDRFNAKIVRVQSDPARVLLEGLATIYWWKGTQNVRVTGKFGFTEYDGGVTPEGVTPDLIKWACRKLAIKELAPMSDPEWDEDHARARIRMEKTRDQSIAFASPYQYKHGGSGVGRVLTGEPVVDAVLSSFVRPPAARGV